jgi:uncharacterized protein (TIGR00251 family)
MSIEEFKRNFRLKLKAKGEAYFDVKVRPSAGKSQIIAELDDETIKIDLAAPAEKGKANEELIKLLAKELAVSRASIKIVAGKSNREKLVKISL